MFKNLEILKIITTQEDCDYREKEFNKFSFFRWMEVNLSFNREESPDKVFVVRMPLAAVYELSEYWWEKFRYNEEEILRVSSDDDFVDCLVVEYVEKNHYRLELRNVVFNHCTKKEILQFITDINKLYLEECLKYPNGKEYVDEVKSKGFLSYDL